MSHRAAARSRSWLHLAALLLAVLLPFAAAAAPASAAPVEGEDYVRIDDGQPWAPLKGQVEVVEVFGYGCGYCAQLAPKLEAWKRGLPAGVRVTYLPLPHHEADPLARAFFAAQAAGALPRTHARTFSAIHDDGLLPHNPTIDEIAAFYGSLGLDAAKLRGAMESPAVAARLPAAREFAIRSGVEGTPTLIINGKYRVTGRTLEDNLRIAGALVARERAAVARR